MGVSRMIDEKNWRAVVRGLIWTPRTTSQTGHGGPGLWGYPAIISSKGYLARISTGYAAADSSVCVSSLGRRFLSFISAPERRRRATQMYKDGFQEAEPIKSSCNIWGHAFLFCRFSDLFIFAGRFGFRLDCGRKPYIRQEDSAFCVILLPLPGDNEPDFSRNRAVPLSVQFIKRCNTGFG